MEFRILGPLEVTADGRALDLGGHKQRALLALLLLQANRVVSSDRLIEALWEEEPPGTAPKALQVHVSQLRKLLGRERLETRAPGYLLRVEPDELDLARFERLQRGGDGSTDALALWRGPPLADFAYQRFAEAEIARLEELRLACLEERIERRPRRGAGTPSWSASSRRWSASTRCASACAASSCSRSTAPGRQAEALDAYQDARRALVDELGIEPGRELRELEQAILAQDPRSSSTAEVAATPSARRTLRRARARARRARRRARRGARRARRPVLLAGEPGIGKSRLAEELATRARDRGARVLVGRCWEAGGAPAYWPWVQALRSCCARPSRRRVRAWSAAAVPSSRRCCPSFATCSPTCHAAAVRLGRCALPAVRVVRVPPAKRGRGAAAGDRPRRPARRRRVVAAAAALRRRGAQRARRSSSSAATATPRSARSSAEALAELARLAAVAARRAAGAQSRRTRRGLLELAGGRRPAGGLSPRRSTPRRRATRCSPARSAACWPSEGGAPTAEQLPVPEGVQRGDRSPAC